MVFVNVRITDEIGKPARRVTGQASDQMQQRCRFCQVGQEKVLMYKAIDQLRECLDTIMKNPGSRRILFHGWNCAELDAIALPACHLLYQFLPNA